MMVRSRGIVIGRDAAIVCPLAYMFMTCLFEGAAKPLRSNRL